MHDAIFSLLIILLTAIAVVFISGKLRIPSVIGFLIAGIILGPNGLFNIQSQELMESFSEIGIVLMLFTIGLEFSLDDMLRRKKLTLLGGGLQIMLTGAVFTGIILFSDIPFRQALFYAVLATLSSTAVVLKLLNEKQMMNSAVGLASLSLLIFQDIAAVVFIVFLPVMSGVSSQMSMWSLISELGIGLTSLVGIFMIARYVIPKVLYQILRTRNRELFLLCIILIIAGVTIICTELGLSVGLGAFLAGLVIADSDYSNYTLSNIIPFQDLFISVFFISVGFLFDVSFTLNNIGIILPLLLLVFAVKIAVLYPVGIIVGLSSRAAVTVGFALAQIGEFSFVLASLGNKSGLIVGDNYRIFIAVTLLSMALTPMLLFFASKITASAVFVGISEFIDRKRAGGLDTPQANDYEDHLLIIGYGITGKLHARICQKMNLPYVVLEMNPITVRHEKAAGTHIVHGDAASPMLLGHVKAEKARAAVISVPNHNETLKIIRRLRADYPHLFIIARCRHISEMSQLIAAGSDRAVALELESAMEMLSQMMTRYYIAREEISVSLENLRKGFYQSERIPLDKLFNFTGMDSAFHDIETAVYTIPPSSSLIGQTLHDTQMRTRYRVSMLAYKRDQGVYPNPPSDYIFSAGDHIMMFGRREDLNNFNTNYQLL